MIITERRSENRFTIDEALETLASVYPSLTKTRLAKRVLALKRAELIRPTKGENNADLFKEDELNMLSELLHLEEQGVSLRQAVSILRQTNEPVEYATLSRADLIGVIQKLSEEHGEIATKIVLFSNALRTFLTAPLWKRLLWALFPERLQRSAAVLKDCCAEAQTTRTSVPQYTNP